MARRNATRGISKDRVYTTKTAARLIGVSEATLRKWSNEGLRLIRDQRPHMARGADLIEFLKKRKASNKVPMAKGQFYCMTCKAPRNPRDGSVSFEAKTALTGRLSGVCGTCGGAVGQFCSTSNAAKFVNAPPTRLKARSDA